MTRDDSLAVKVKCENGRVVVALKRQEKGARAPNGRPGAVIKQPPLGCVCLGEGLCSRQGSTPTRRYKQVPRSQAADGRSQFAVGTGQLRPGPLISAETWPEAAKRISGFVPWLVGRPRTHGEQKALHCTVCTVPRRRCINWLQRSKMTLGKVGFAVQLVFHFFLWLAANSDGRPCLAIYTAIHSTV